MQQCLAVKRWLGSASLVGVLLIASGGCRAWRSTAVPGKASLQSERQVLGRARHDPFPAPSDVGME